MFIIHIVIKTFIINLIYLIKYALQQSRKLISLFYRNETSLNIKEISMIIGNLQFEFVLTDLVVKSATCLETGVVYNYKKANELFRKYQVYL